MKELKLWHLIMIAVVIGFGMGIGWRAYDGVYKWVHYATDKWYSDEVQHRRCWNL